MSNAKRVSLTVNGKSMELEEGKNLLQALIDHEFEVPHFCYHPGLGPDGNCRMCMVEVGEGDQAKVTTSCTLSVQEGMVVQTQSKDAKSTRKNVLEFILLNHPLDCPFCDKGGECPLQNYTLDEAQTTSRYTFEKSQKEKHKVIGEHIILDQERCILCDRCTRFGREIAGKEELTIRNRGGQNKIDISDGQPLTSGFTGNYADFCPVGALTTIEYRFKARPWETQTFDSICGGCSVGCNLQIWRKESSKEVLRLTPRVHPDVNEWWLCDKGRFSLHEVPEADNRVLTPRFQDNKDLTDADSVLIDISHRLQEAARPAIWLGQKRTNEEIILAKELATRAGAKVFGDFSNKIKDFYTRYQSRLASPDVAADLLTQDHMVIVGETLETNHPVLALRMRRLARQFNKNIHTFAPGKPEFADVTSATHVEIDAASFGQNPKDHLPSGKKAVWLSHQWIEETDVAQWQALVDALGEEDGLYLLLSGVNERGLLDQSNDIESQDAFASSLNNFDMLLMLGAYPHALDSGISLDIGCVMMAMQKEILPAQTTHVLPEVFFTEQKGTQTNTLGHVQKLKPAHHVVPGAYTLIHMMSKWLLAFGYRVPEMEELFGLVAKDQALYPKRLQDIQEMTHTYDHYERTQWR